MLEIPSLATAMAALGLLQLRWRDKWCLPELLSGALVGAALQMKLVPAILVVLVPMLLWFKRKGKDWELKRVLTQAAVFGVTLLISYVLIDVAIGEPDKGKGVCKG